MSIELISTMLKRGPDGLAERMVMVVLAWHANTKGTCWPSIKTIAKEAAMTDRAVRRVINRLEADGWLRVTRGRGRSHPNRYLIIDRSAGPMFDFDLDQPGATKPQNRTESPGLRREKGDLESSIPPRKGGSRVLNSDAQKGTVSTQKEDRGSDEPSRTLKEDIATAAAHFLRVYPRQGDDTAVATIFEQLSQSGVEMTDVLEGAQAYAREQADNDVRFIMYPENWLRKRAWLRVTRKSIKNAQPPRDWDPVAAAAENINSGKPYLCRSIPTSVALRAVELGLTNRDQCRAMDVL